MSEIRSKLLFTWGAGSPHACVYERMLCQLKPGATDYLPLSQLRDLLGKEIPDDLFDRVIFWFSTDAAPLLEQWYEYLGDDTEEGGIEPVRVAQALVEGVLRLSTGEVAHDFREHVFPYFRGTDLLTAELIRARSGNE